MNCDSYHGILIKSYGISWNLDSHPYPHVLYICNIVESITSIPWIQPGSDSSLFSLISLQESNGTLDSRNNRGKTF